MILLVNKVLTKPRVRGKTHHKTSLYSKLEKASMLIGTAGLLGGVIGPVIAPAEEVLAVSRSEMQKRAKQGGSGGKAAPLGTSERKPGPSKKKSGGKGGGPKVHGKLPNKLDMSYPVPWGNGIYHENALGSNAGKLTGVDTDHGYYSKSNTYRDTKLDPYLGKNPAIAEEKGHSKIIILLADDIHGR